MAAPTETSVTLNACCKVNLFLRIICRRSDGYHEIKTLFYPLPEPHDSLLVTPLTAGSGLHLTCSRKELETGSNLVAKTYAAFASRTGFSPGLSIHLEKRIPTGAGLGGGSSDAAVLLAYLNDLAGEQALSTADMTALAASLGADVPYFLLHGRHGKPALATGIGESLFPIQVDLDGYWLVLVCPPEHVSTPWAYGAWDRLYPEKTCSEEDLAILTATNQEASNLFCPETTALGNDFEAAVFPAFPELAKVKDELLDRSAAHAVMSGSGAAIFALYRDADIAKSTQLAFLGRSVPAYAFPLPCWGVAKW
ncbi:4-(cytidine 5'-diphospho)-2-C-methyl-D-erythritol kinase [Desulfocurvibacter africanus]|uniref:4-(cytidine 5'-diphospho)-2-C-methyl-D-erythritol kinase n=1 Tax=Desulfocurvibacter africanus TaxID=873 RepID=UPI002FD912B6